MTCFHLCDNDNDNDNDAGYLPDKSIGRFPILFPGPLPLLAPNEVCQEELHQIVVCSTGLSTEVCTTGVSMYVGLYTCTFMYRIGSIFMSIIVV